ncbi:MAG: hypothetical protein JWM33_1081 [Caulobacteraceae bacterium]|nr:hypothetical protein [Caulobacteraceae bacterium]
MRRLTPTLSLICLAVLIAGCQRPAEPPTTPAASAPAKTVSSQFVSEADFEGAGYYLPLTRIQVGDYKLEHISVGSPSDFAQWQEGKREGVFGPIIFRFGDVTSPGPMKEMGVVGYTTQLSLLPTRYVWSPAKVEFAGTDPHLGQVSFVGAFDLAGLEQVRGEPDQTRPVLKGVLKIGDQTFADTAFGFWPGD